MITQQHLEQQRAYDMLCALRILDPFSKPDADSAVECYQTRSARVWSARSEGRFFLTVGVTS